MQILEIGVPLADRRASTLGIDGGAVSVTTGGAAQAALGPIDAAPAPRRVRQVGRRR